MVDASADFMVDASAGFMVDASVGTTPVQAISAGCCGELFMNYAADV
jgi:hypothetical protein